MKEKHSKKQLEEKIKELENGWQRCQADFLNFQKRSDSQRQDLIEFEKADILAKLSPVLDNFQRAFDHLDISDPKIAGVKQIEKQLEDILISEGLEKIDASGNFDPAQHEAISYETNDLPADRIISQVESGWKYKNRVLKPAKVRVSKGPNG